MQGYDTQTAETMDKTWNDRLEQFMKRNKSKLVFKKARECLSIDFGESLNISHMYGYSSFHLFSFFYFVSLIYLGNAVYNLQMQYATCYLFNHFCTPPPTAHFPPGPFSLRICIQYIQFTSITLKL